MIVSLQIHNNSNEKVCDKAVFAIHCFDYAAPEIQLWTHLNQSQNCFQIDVPDRV